MTKTEMFQNFCIVFTVGTIWFKVGCLIFRKNK